MAELPFDTTLPFFAYGTLKSSELAFRQIREHVLEIRPSILEGFELAVIDGLPRAFESEGEFVQGEILFVTPAAYPLIAIYEQVPKAYRWVTSAVGDQAVNLVCYAEPQILTRHDKVNSWSAADDTLLAHGTVWSVREIAKANLFVQNTGSSSRTSDAGKYSFIELQATYAILWSIFERLTLFCEGPLLSDEKMIPRIQKLSGIDAWTSAVEKVKITSNLGVRSSSNPHDRPTRAGDFGFEAWYKIRNNVIHRGKSAGKEFTQLLAAASDLCRTLTIFIQNQSPSIARFFERELTAVEKDLILQGFTQGELGRWEKENAERSNGVSNS